MPQILKKLRIKFMLMTTGIVAILVIVIAGGYCISIYKSASEDVDLALDRAVNASVGVDSILPRQENPDAENQNSENERQGFEGGVDSGQIFGSMQNPDGDQRIDFFKGQSALVYSVVIDENGTILRTDSPAISLDEAVLTSAIDIILSSSDFSQDENADFSGKIATENLFYHAKTHNGNIYVALTDSSNFDTRMNEAIFGSLALAGVALVLTVLISFFLARLFLRPVEEAWTKQRRFIADASHELKTPLTVIMANTEIVRSEPQKKVTSNMKWLDGIMDESERMQGLIADLLLLARMDDEQQNEVSNITQEAFDFSEMVVGSIVSFEAIAFERHIQIEEDIESGICIKGVPSRLVRLPDILLDNACKYAKSTGIVKISLKSEGNKAVLRIFNTGPEIPDEDMTHLFDRFYRADEARSDDIPGYGLGLSIARSIVEESEGTIEAANIANEGVTFTVTLPLSA